MTSEEAIKAGESTTSNEIDLSVLDGLLALSKPGSPDPRKRIIAIYIDSSAKLMEAIRSAFTASDPSVLKKAAHSLKSSSMNVGAIGLGTICSDLELLAKTGPLDEAGGLLERAETSYKAVIASMEEALLNM
jgi:two-component system, sensor histidine kinase